MTTTTVTTTTVTTTTVTTIRAALARVTRLYRGRSVHSRFDPHDALERALFADRECVNGAGAAVDGTLTFDATMPDHGHGMNVEPTVSSSATGDTSSGINLHMPGIGNWTLVSMLMAQLQTQRLITSVPKGRFNFTMRLIGFWLLALMLLCGCGRACQSSPGLKRNSASRSRIWD